jgi:alpha-beta hydrolase superfamily lysophospholipase
MDFVICARNIENKKFGNEPGKTTFLCVPSNNNTLPQPSHIEPSSQKWVKTLLSGLAPCPNPGSDTTTGDILVFIHGYKNSQQTVMARHRLLKDGLKSKGFNGIVVSFDWPSAGDSAIYLEDRHDAKKTALQLVSDGISLLCKCQQPHCQVNIHVLAHSMGGFCR